MTRFLIFLGGTYALDMASKMVIRKSMALGQEIHLLPFFSLTHVQNTGVAFGLFQGMNVLFIMVGSVVTMVVVWLGVRMSSRDPFSSVLLAVVLGGALGNLTDRIFFGCVTDFLDFFIGQYHWPAFNVADSAVCVGAGLLLWNNLKQARLERH